MHLIIIPIKELELAKEIKSGLENLMSEVLLLEVGEGSLEFLRCKERGLIKIRPGKILDCERKKILS